MLLMEKELDKQSVSKSWLLRDVGAVKFKTYFIFVGGLLFSLFIITLHSNNKIIIKTAL